tara:strand:+ start:547 stop:969 length:423 start_codon:yes stop_codon:yes gene_type:complete
LYFILAEILIPINCVLKSQEIPNISIILSERRSTSLKGNLFKNKNNKGNIYTFRPVNKNNAKWIFDNSNNKFSGDMLLLKDHKIWHPYQNEINSSEVNKVLFFGLTSKLSKIYNEKDLLKATSGFFLIGDGCYGGKINKV